MKKSSNSIKYGDVFRLGSHLLLCADSRNKDMIAKLVGTHKIKAVIADPPYGVAVAESKEGFQTLAKNKPILNDHLQSGGSPKSCKSSSHGIMDTERTVAYGAKELSKQGS